MSDDADITDEVIEKEMELSLRIIMNRANRMPKGSAGECDECGFYFSRIVNGMCGRCRDETGSE